MNRPLDSHEIQVSAVGTWEQGHGVTLEQIRDLVRFTMSPDFKKGGYYTNIKGELA
jgi:hypothetical protein